MYLFHYFFFLKERNKTPGTISLAVDTLFITPSTLALVIYICSFWISTIHLG